MGTPLSGNTDKITNITEMANAILDGSGAGGFTAEDGHDYGCAGRGSYDQGSVKYKYKKLQNALISSSYSNTKKYKHNRFPEN